MIEWIQNTKPLKELLRGTMTKAEFDHYNGKYDDAHQFSYSASVSGVKHCIRDNLVLHCFYLFIFCRDGPNESHMKWIAKFKGAMPFNRFYGEMYK